MRFSAWLEPGGKGDKTGVALVKGCARLAARHGITTVPFRLSKGSGISGHRCELFHVLFAAACFQGLADSPPCAHCHEHIADNNVADNGSADLRLIQKGGNALEGFKKGHVVFPESLVDLNAQADLFGKQEHDD